MSRIAWLVAVCGLALAPASLVAADTKPVDQVEKSLVILLDQEVDLGDKNLSEVPIFELLAFLSKQHDLSFVVSEERFKEIGRPNFKEEKPKLAATRFKGVSLYQFLTVVLDSMDATFLVKQSGIEIVPIAFAAEVTKSATTKTTEGRVRLNEPLVSVIVKDKSLNEVVTKLAKDFDLNILVLPRAGNVDGKPITIRLLNVPADKAIEAIALQCDLEVVRKGTTFLLTGSNLASDQPNEKSGKKQQITAGEKARPAPARTPTAPAPLEKASSK